ncbi:SPOR domain-containing protein [Pseudaestuariivita rosea]|uniref:SPOR domain-containing protein n=1 Tax=Pseudaestuariivita rosea TaxID=2763263 RepID=UPI001ABABA7A|nr:SPOR domain-containing protein [Pseudaestuariivita rosea]
MTGVKIPVILATTAIILLAGCENSGFANLNGTNADRPATRTAIQPLRQVERDVESPEVFLARETGLWDGRPSLGGVWVAHPDVDQPERAIIRNVQTGNSIVGALFRRERELPGPRIQVSSDAAKDLGLIAGQPVELEVVALRSETVEVGPAADAPAETQPLGAPSDIEATELDPAKSLDDPIEAAAAAIAQAEAEPLGTAVENEIVAEPALIGTTAPDGTITPAAVKPADPEERKGLFALRKPFIEVGLYTDTETAQRTVDQLRLIDIDGRIRETQEAGTTLYRVIVGPASSRSERSFWLQTIKAQGYREAYNVEN